MHFDVDPDSSCSRFVLHIVCRQGVRRLGLLMRLNRIPKTTLLVLATVSLSCTDSTGPATGSLDVTISTASAVIDVDPDGYSLRVDAEAGRSIPATSAALHLDLPPGNHAVRLEGLAPNCSMTGPTELSVEVISGRTTFVAFGVTCVANTGTIRVTTSTSGAGASDSDFIS